MVEGKTLFYVVPHNSNNPKDIILKTFLVIMVKKERKPKAVIILSIILCISILLNIFLLFSIGAVNMQWENDYNNMFVEYCEFTNDHGDVINDLIIELQIWDSFYEDIELYENADCWNNNNGVYQGPIPLGYNDEHFKETGETIEEVSR
jgi:hypothetical protein